MKKHLVAATAALMANFAFTVHAQVPKIELNMAAKVSKGANAFATEFNENATGRNDKNAYLLCYLSTMIYPQYLGIKAGDASERYANTLHTDIPKFEAEFKKQTSFLLESPQYTFVRESHPIGYDPEAMVISTPQAVYVVFRGTDRVASNQVSTFTYDWGEWLLSDFDTRHLTTPELTGKVHAGFWLSLIYNNFKDKLLQEIRNKGGNSKKVWITGHSLGAAHAQVFAMYMAKKGLTPQGVYAYAAPHPGTQEFVDEMDKLFPNGRLQRFDFVNDPVTMLSFYSLGFRRAGTRVYYNDIKTIDYDAPERGPQEGLALFPALTGVVTNLAADYISEKSSKRLKLDPFNVAGSPFCYHHPIWYLQAAYHQLSASQKSKMPAPIAVPDKEAEACDILTVARGRSGNPVNIVQTAVTEVAADIAETVEKIRFTANAILSNVTGSAIEDGDYYIKAYPSKNNLYLNELDGISNGSDMKLTTGKSKVKVMRTGAGGYVIRFGTKTHNGLFGSETKEFVLDNDANDLFDDNSTTIQLWERNHAPGFNANQRWLFIKLKDNKYVIKNVANGRVLDANNDNINGNSCKVKTYGPLADDQTQIWVLERAN